VDSNVLMDLLLGRRNKLGQDLAERAAILIERALRCKHVLVVSDWTLRELRKNGVDVDRLAMLLGFIGDKLRTVSVDEEDWKAAKELDPNNVSDALHVMLALKAGADVIATRNLRHFLKYRRLIDVELPENL